MALSRSDRSMEMWPAAFQAAPHNGTLPSSFLATKWNVRGIELASERTSNQDWWFPTSTHGRPFRACSGSTT